MTPTTPLHSKGLLLQVVPPTKTHPTDTGPSSSVAVPLTTPQDMDQVKLTCVVSLFLSLTCKCQCVSWFTWHAGCNPLSIPCHKQGASSSLSHDLRYMSQHIALAKSGADGHNGRVWASTLVLHQKMAHASEHSCPKMSCKMHPGHHTTYPWTMLNCSAEAETSRITLS